MKKLRLPVIRNNVSKPRVLSMDEYLKFVQFNWEHIIDRKANAKWKEISAVNVPFVTKD